MAAPITELPCRLCNGILPKKQRRTIFGETFGVFDQLLEIIDYVPHQNDAKGKYVCGLCWNKLNRLARIEKDISTKLQTLKEERHSLVTKLRDLHKSAVSSGKPLVGTLKSAVSSGKPLVGTPSSKKRYIIHSPTPRKLKKSLTNTPDRRVQTDVLATCSSIDTQHQSKCDQEKEHPSTPSRRQMKTSTSKQLFSLPTTGLGVTDPDHELLQCINLLNKLGLCVSASATAKKKADLMKRQQSHIEQLVITEKKAYEEKTGEDTMLTSDIVGDNFDISKSPSHMSKEKQRKSFHWFMLVGLQKRVLSNVLGNDIPTVPITKVENSIFIPSLEECKSLKNNFTFHIMKVLVKYLACFKKYEPHLAKHIEHPHLQEMSKKSDFAILELLEKNENKSEDMISILEHIHRNYIPSTAEDHVIRKKVFGGDVLTNERAYSAQLAMLNGATESEQLAGVIHRPEGLHRMMNLCLVTSRKSCICLMLIQKIIYQQFYRTSSTIDRGTLSQLRNIVHRVDAQGPDRVIDSYRAHAAFLNDCLDAFIVGACMHHLGIDDVGAEPKRKQVLFEAVSSDDKRKFLEDIASEIQHKYINLENGILAPLEPRSQDLDLQELQIKEMFDAAEGKYHCKYCDKTYKMCGHLKNHLKKEHDWQDLREDRENEKSTKIDHIALYRASFMKCALLLRDTQDAYSLGDGDRIVDNAKFQMLLSGIGNHTKYQLWLFRFLANFHCLLSPKDAYEYKWNCTTNLKGGTGHNIPNDNLVEILVHRLKVKLQAQGANVTYASARKAAMTLQVQDEIKENMMVQCGSKPKGTSRTATSVTSDINVISNELLTEEVFDYIPGRQFENFKNFKDLFAKVKIMELHKWITKQKERLSYATI
ncbi:uncharacterized protein [Argopecten irradians]|uniref:uncharacterized protein n=1 Tax=Argopecten irradians TaxID=31199 RepID=UPI003712417C